MEGVGGGLGEVADEAAGARAGVGDFGVGDWGGAFCSGLDVECCALVSGDQGDEKGRKGEWNEAHFGGFEVLELVMS